MTNSSGINHKQFNIGDLVYFIEQKGHNYSVKFGIVKEHYTTEICVQLYEIFDSRLVNGIPIKDFKTPTKWYKLPKNWSYDTKLFDITYNNKVYNELKDCKMNKSTNLLKAIKNNLLVKVQDNDHCTLETEIDKTKGWRIVRKYDLKHNPIYLSIRYDKVYRTYEEAQKVIDDIKAEWVRQSKLSDYEWSKEQIVRNLNRYCTIYNVSDEDKEEYKERIFALNNLEDIETRIYARQFQWKYDYNKKWITICL